MTTDEFIRIHRTDDVRALALKASGKDGVDVPLALEQIAGWQAARHKLPSWAAIEGVIYPPHLSMEQCSSEETARYKANIAKRFLADEMGESILNEDGLGSMTDLTGGFGVDFSFLARGFKDATYVERNPNLCDKAIHNFPLLDLNGAKVVCSDAAEHLSSMSDVDLIFLDPARRDANGGRTFAIADCTPDVISLLPTLLSKARVVMVKLSPMLDWHKAVTDLQGHVAEVHIVSVDGECKELLLLLTSNIYDSVRVICVNGAERFEFTELSGTETSSLNIETPMFMDFSPYLDNTASAKQRSSEDNLYLYEPNASIMKSGAFNFLATRYGVRPIGGNSHLFVSSDKIGDFPGRKFQISAISSMNKQQLKRTLSGTQKANISVRNFPLTTNQLRQKLKLKDGGDIFLFATTTADNRHIIMLCRRF